MFKLFRDSIFAPKKIIYYRAKKVWYVIVYMILVSMVSGIAFCVKPLSLKTMSYDTREDIVKSFEGTNAKIVDGVYSADCDILADFGYCEVGFYKSTSSLSGLSEYPTFAVIGSDVDYVVESSLSSGVSLYKIATIESLSSDLKDVDLSNLNVESPFFDTVKGILQKYVPALCTAYFFIGLFNGMISMLVYALITYFFMMVFMRAGQYMRKGQLYKMLLFASTSVVIMESLTELFNLNTIISWILLFISFIPLGILEREIMNRIRMKIFGEALGNNDSIINKFNDMIKNLSGDDSQDDDDDDNDNNDNDNDNNEES